MINPFLIAYFFILVIFLGGVFAILYHLQVYKFNLRVSLFVSALFLVGTMILLTINIVLAMKINWDEFVIVF